MIVLKKMIELGLSDGLLMLPRSALLISTRQYRRQNRQERQNSNTRPAASSRRRRWRQTRLERNYRQTRA